MDPVYDRVEREVGRIGRKKGGREEGRTEGRKEGRERKRKAFLYEYHVLNAKFTN